MSNETKFHVVIDRTYNVVTLCSRWIDFHKRPKGVKLWAALRKPEKITCKDCQRILNSGKKGWFHIRRVAWINLETGGIRER